MENLGKKARDKVTGFQGVIIGKCYYLTGCNQYGITPHVIDNKVGDTQWFDEKRVEVISEGVQAEEVADVSNPGGPNRDQPKI